MLPGRPEASRAGRDLLAFHPIRLTLPARRSVGVVTHTAAISEGLAPPDCYTIQKLVQVQCPGPEEVLGHPGMVSVPS